MKQAYVDDCPYYLDDFLTNMKVVKDRSDRTEEAYFIDIRTFLRYLNVKHHAVPAETPFNKIKIKENANRMARMLFTKRCLCLFKVSQR